MVACYVISPAMARRCVEYIKMLDWILKFIHTEHDLIYDVVNDRNVQESSDPDDTASKLEGSVSSPEPMLKFVRHCELDAHMQMAIAAKVQILPLTRQLTNLAGNSW